jgi:hypothetical protein
MTHHQPARRSSRHDPDLILAYLRYALEDVREFSERGGRELELAIRALTEDTRVIRIKEPARNVQPS